MLKILLLGILFIYSSYSLTCYNGSKMLAMQAVGETTEECPASSYCYNMSTSAYVMLNIVKAGCSTWRCMLAKDTCIFTTFQAIPVSLCCCSYDRCNVGGNPVYSDNAQNMNSNWNSGGGSSGNANNGPSGGSWGNGNGNGNNGGGQNNNGWGNNNDWSSNYNYGGQNAAKEETMTRQSVGSANTQKPGQLSDKQVAEMFKKSIDDRGDEIQLEDDFKKIDKNYKTQSAPVTRTLSARKEVEHIPLGAKTSPTTASNKKMGGNNGEIQI